MANGITIRPLGPLVDALRRYGQRLYRPPDDTIRGIEPNTWYSPLQPVKPMGPAGVEPRGFQYWAGQNLLWTPRADAEYSAADLKELSRYPLARIAIENVKDVLTEASWEVQPRPEPGESRKAARKRGLGDENLVKLSRFLEMPDREHVWPEWLRPLLEDMLVIDAWTILIRKTYNGEVVELPVLRGESIVRYIDENGFTPAPPQPAYAQNWWGIPLVNLSTEQLVYKPRNIVPRNTIASQLYGMSPTEQLAPELEVGRDRLAFIAAYYKEGSIPGVVQVVPRGTAPDKIAEAMQWMNSELAGNLAARRQWRLVQGFNEPGKPEQIEYTKEPLLTDLFDELHIRKVAFGYGISPQRLMRMMNRASAEASQKAADIEGVMPYFASLKALLDFIIQRRMGYVDYELVFDPFVEPDITKETERVKVAVGGALLTPNEGREKLGEERYDDPVADELGVVTGSGFVPIGEAAAQPAAGGADGGAAAAQAGAGGKRPADGDEAGDGEGAGDDDRGGDGPRKPRTVREQRVDKPNGGKLALQAQAPQVREAQAPIGFMAGAVTLEKYSEDQPRDERGMWTEAGGGALAETDESSEKNLNSALDGWTNGDLMVGDEVAELVEEDPGKIVELDPARSPAEALLNGIRNGTDFKKPIYRGMWLSEGERTPFDKLNKGDTFDVHGAASFTTDRSVGALFASKDSPTNPHGAGVEGKGARGIMFEVSGARGLEVGARGSKEFGEQHEVITNGTFRVTSVSWVNTGARLNVLTIKATHQGTH